ncbi:MAG: peptidoglycan DD-metalloendopeptidase family protein [Candidatus Wallbacteria bacterium]|nr:peptidoglycan DD-metalloendopeptidase family protein [Candidatus Wallbacteria bacterium]
MEKRSTKALSALMALLMLPEPTLAARKTLRPTNYPAASAAGIQADQPVRKARRGGIQKLIAGKKGQPSQKKKPGAKKGAAKAPQQKELAQKKAISSGSIEVEPIGSWAERPSEGERVATIELERHSGKVSHLSEAALAQTAASPKAPLPRLQVLEGEASLPSPEARQPRPVSVTGTSDSEAVPISQAPVVQGWKGGYHDVKAGQDVDSLARRYGVPRESITKFNRVPDTGPIPEGRRLFIPPASYQASAAPPVAKTATAPAPRTISAQLTSKPASPARIQPPLAAAPQVAGKAEEEDDGEPGAFDKIKDTIGGVFDSFKKLINRARGKDTKDDPGTGAGDPATASVAPAAELVSRSPQSSTRPAFEWPISGQIISPYGPRHGVPHNGIDVSARRGTTIHAVAAGKVIFASVMRGYGNVIILDHGNRYFTVYAHNQRNLVGKTDGAHPIDVKIGQAIALVGDSGNAQAPHLHFEVRYENKAIDPMPFLPAGGGLPQARKPAAANDADRG